MAAPPNNSLTAPLVRAASPGYSPVDEDQRQDWSWVGRPLTWIAITIVTAYAAVVIASPTPCSEVEECVASWDNFERTSNAVSVYAVGGLATALILEVVSLYLSYQSAKPIIGLIKGVEANFVPLAMMCVAFAALLAENATFAYSTTPWYLHAAAPGIAGHSGRPVYTIFYAEWLINVPILIMVSGKFALFRQLEQLSRPLVITNGYIVLSWYAHFVESAMTRRAVVGLAFAMYGWASYDMIAWVTAFRERVRKDLPSRTLRPALTLALVALFGIYGVIYVCALEGVISSETERFFYQCNDLGARFVMLMSFAHMRVSQYYDLITMLLVNGNTNFARHVSMRSGGRDEQLTATRSKRKGASMDLEDCE